MVQRIASQVVGSTETILCFLRRYDNLIQSQRALVESYLQILYIFAQINLDRCRHISQTGNFKNVCTGLDFIQTEFTVKVGCSPEIIFTKSYCGAYDRYVCPLFGHYSGQRDIPAGLCSKNFCKTQHQQHQRYEDSP